MYSARLVSCASERCYAKLRPRSSLKLKSPLEITVYARKTAGFATRTSRWSRLGTETDKPVIQFIGPSCSLISFALPVAPPNSLLWFPSFKDTQPPVLSGLIVPFLWENCLFSVVQFCAAHSGLRH